MDKNYWKRFNNYEKGLALFFMINLVFDIINKELLNLSIPIEILGYFFWLSLGLYAGFLLCKYENKRVWKKIEKEEQEKKVDRNNLYNHN